MKFMICVIDTGTGTGSAQEIKAIDQFNETLLARQQLLMAEGIQSPEKSVVVDNRSGAGLKRIGPLHQTTEFVSGFWVVTVASQSEAEEMAFEASRACNRKVELRALIG